MKPTPELPDNPDGSKGISRRGLLGSAAALAAGLFAPRALGYAFVNPPNDAFKVDGDHFLLRGKPFQVISGEMHYARIPREYWTHRIRMAKAMGVNTIATYVFWNLHEPRPGEYEFGGNADIAAFIRAVQAEGLNVLLRAGPYSCAEWEFGGFPAWLMKDPRMKTALRSNDDAFMLPAARWLKRLAAETAPLLIAHGGPIVAVQVENEYGNFGNEPGYMAHMLQIFQSTGWNEALLYTVDPSKALAHGCLDGIFAGVNFGTGNAEPGLAALARLRPGQPLFATEYWPGWFDLWGHPHETRPIEPQLKDIEYILSHGASINIYMVHGGTTFGMWPGASASTGNYRGNVTSYDYDAPIDEAGHATPKFFAYRDLILKYTRQPALPVPEPPKVVAIPAFEVRPVRNLWTILPKPIASEKPVTMEMVDQAYGYILYRTTLADTVSDAPLVIDPVHDFAQIYLDEHPRHEAPHLYPGGVLAGTLDRHYNQTTVSISAGKGSRIDILVENTGRLNSTRHMREEWKGVQSVTLGGKALTGWEVYSLPMAKPPMVEINGLDPNPERGPHTAFGSFRLTDTGDAFLDVTALGKGLIWINGHALGRFWNIGPQDTLYVPAPWLKKGANEVVVFDLFPATKPQTLAGRMKPILDGPTPTYADDPERKKKAAADAEFGPKLAAPATPPKE
jgi:beta-galactosidase